MQKQFSLFFSGTRLLVDGRIPDMDIFGFLFCCAAVFGPGSGADVRTPDKQQKKNLPVAFDYRLLGREREVVRCFLLFPFSPTNDGAIAGVLGHWNFQNLPFFSSRIRG